MKLKGTDTNSCDNFTRESFFYPEHWGQHTLQPSPAHCLYKPSPKRWGGGAGGPGLWGTSCPSSLLDALQTLHIPSPQPGLAPQFGSLTMGWESSPGSHVFSHLSNRWDRAHVIICQFVETLSSLPAPYTGEPWIAWVHLKVDFIQ